MKTKTKALGLILLAGLMATLAACAPKEAGSPPDSPPDASNATPSTPPSTPPESEPDPTPEVATVGEFTTQDINGNAFSQDIFSDYDLTLVNIFTTWCPPCVEEIPGLEQLRKDMADRGVNVVGFVMDGADFNGNPLEDGIEAAKVLAQRTGATYPFLLPDGTGLNGRLYGSDSVPETFFVDREGNIVGETYVGARSLEKWTAIVEAELENLPGAAA